MKNKLLLCLSLIGLIGSTCISYTSGLISKIKSKSDVVTRKEGQLNKTNKHESLNAVGEILLEELNKYVDSSKYSISRIKEMKDFNNNTYVLVEFNPIGYAIYNVSNGDVVECAPTSYSPYLKSESNDLYYLPWVGYFKKDSNKYSNLMSKRELNDFEISEYQKESRNYHTKSLEKMNENNIERTLKGSTKRARTRRNANITNHSWATLIYADTEVPYSWYFKRNSMEFVGNDGDSCGYTALSFLLAYNEIFMSTGYFSAAQAAQYITPYHGSRFGDGVPVIDDSFLYEFGSNPGGANMIDLINATNDFMEGKIRRYSIHHTVGLFTDLSTPIEDGFPCIYLGNMPMVSGGTGSHGVVVYGLYDDGKVLCHYGWAGYSQVVMSNISALDSTGAFAIYNESVHAHNTYFIMNNLTYCGCGQYITC